jgi:hypothetical protein
VEVIFVGLSSDLISQFVKATNDKTEPVKESTVYGTTVVYGEDIYVKLDGSELLTPVDTTANVVDGERVTVMIKNHSATITGNITSPSARGKDVEMTVSSLNIKIDGVGDMASDAASAAGDAKNAANNASNAASAAQSAANSAANAANNASNAALEAKRHATDYLTLDNSGLELGNKTLNTNVLITPNSIDFRTGDTILASYQSEYIYLGVDSRKATIDLANGVARMYNEDDTNDDYSRFVIEADHSIKLNTMCGIYENVYYDDGVYYGEASIHMESHVPWQMMNADAVQGVISMYATSGTKSNYATSSIFLDGETASIGYADSDNTYSEIVFMNSGNVQLTGEQLFCNVTSTYIDSHVTLSNNRGLLGTFTDTVTTGSLIQLNNNDNTVIGYGGWLNSKGQTNLYGKNIHFFVGSVGDSYAPYYKSGDSVSGEWYGGGFISSSSSKVYFSIPLSKPVIGSPSVSVSSVNGLLIRQNNKYCYTNESTYAKPSSYSAVVAMDGNSIRITATMPNTINTTNNDTCGMASSIKITFS